MKIPGVVWSGLLVALPLIAIWLGDSFPGAVWVAPVAGLLLIVVKVVEVVRMPAPAQPPPGVSASDIDAEPSKASRILWG
jgi:hypothetical protein